MEAPNPINAIPGTPLWMTIVGWIVTLVAAIIPVIIQGKKQKNLALDISKLKRIKANSIDKFQFMEERSSLLSKLGEFEVFFDRGVKGKNTLIELGRLLVRIDSYANRLDFSRQDQLIISSFSEKITQALESNCFDPTDLSSSDLEKIKVILEKGDNLQ